MKKYTSINIKVTVPVGKKCETTEYQCQFLSNNDDGEYRCELFHEDITDSEKCGDCLSLSRC